MKLGAGAGVDLVALITDGNPPARSADGSGGSGSVINLLDLTAA